MAFRKAERRQAKLRLGLIGPSGAGKTYGALLVAQGIGGKIALIDSENGRGELYANLCEYDVCPLTPPFTPDKYIAVIHEAERMGYATIIIDSLSHAWAGAGGILEQVDARKGRGNDFAAWRDVTPKHNQLVDAMLQSPCHIIATMRAKTAYEMEKDERTGKVKPVKVGLAPVQREGMDYEFTVVLEIDQQKHMAVASKDRTSLFDGDVFKLSKETGEKLKNWLESGLPAEAMNKSAKPQQSAPLSPQEQAIKTLKNLLVREEGLGLKPEEAAGWIKKILGREDIKGLDSLSPQEVELCLKAARDSISMVA